LGILKYKIIYYFILFNLNFVYGNMELYIDANSDDTIKVGKEMMISLENLKNFVFQLG
jgi:hypothetical protein